MFKKTYFLPVIGLVEPEELKPGDLVVSVFYDHLIRHSFFIFFLKILK